ncbi:MAG: hypothetical protein Q7S21_00370 [archaeon]|nr:hypothetical protein [archaeon]
MENSENKQNEVKKSFETGELTSRALKNKQELSALNTKQLNAKIFNEKEQNKQITEEQK